MTPRAARVLNGWLALPEIERREVEAEIRKYREAGNNELLKANILKSLQEGTRISLGPVNQGCICCGRS